jgi:hypothetical protein
MKNVLIFDLLLVFVAIFSANCQTPCDPREDGFFTGIYGITSGCYENRINEKEEKIKDEILKQEKLELKAKEKQEEMNRMKKSLEKASQRVATLEETIKVYRGRLVQEQRLRAIDEAELRGLESRLNALKFEIAQAKNRKLTEEEMMNEDINRLTTQIEEIGKMIEEISGR